MLFRSKTLLKPNGWLIINEGVKNLDFLTYTFGLLKGWWLYDDETVRLPGGPTLSLAMWKDVLFEEGFESVYSINESSQEHLDFGQDVIIAESNGIIKRKGRLDEIKSTTKANLVQLKPSSTRPTKPKQERKTTDLKTYIEERIADNLVQALDISPEDINNQKPLADYGVDSITGVDLINKINETFKLQLRTTALFDHANIEGFAKAILDEYGEQIKPLLELESLDSSEASIAVSDEVEESNDSFQFNDSSAETRTDDSLIKTRTKDKMQNDLDRKSTRLNSSHSSVSRMPSSA